MRKNQRGTVSSNSRFRTVLFRQYSANLSCPLRPRAGREVFPRVIIIIIIIMILLTYIIIIMIIVVVVVVVVAVVVVVVIAGC